MNHIYRVVWNESLGVWQAVAEGAPSRGKTKSRRLRSLALAIGLAFAGGAHAADLPTGGSITAGNGSIHQNGAHLTVNQDSGKLAIDWQSFSIGKNNGVTFNQPSASAVALNRVLGPDVSVMQGALNANGQVFLINPNGVLFTPTAQVNVGGLVASTLNLSKEDFLAGNYKFEGDSSNAVINRGSITAAHGGTVALIAAKVENSGSITAQGGNVLLGSGSKVTLDLGGPVRLEVEEGAIDALIKNGGAIKADGGTILLTAKAAEDLAGTVINNDGIIEAKTLATGEHGEIVLLGEQGAVQVAGTLDVSASEGKGGKAVVTGDRVLIADGAHIDATGENGGGEIYVGGGWQGKDGSIANATDTTIAKNATLDASALTDGDGGTVVVWSDRDTRFAGAIAARGGDGGKVEVSGKETFAFSGDVNTGGGLLLLDPTDILVQAADGDGTNTLSGAQIKTLLSNNGSVVLQADNNITWQATATLDYDGIGTGTLELAADNSISFGGKITDGTAGGDALNVVLRADRDGNGLGGVTIGTNGEIHSGGGDVTALGNSVLVQGASIETSGGDIRIGGGDGSFTPITADPLVDDAQFLTQLNATGAALGITISAASRVDAGGGNIDLRGGGGAVAVDGVRISDGSTVGTTAAGHIAIAAAGSGSKYGVYLQDGAQLNASDGGISIRAVRHVELKDDGPTISADGNGQIDIRTTGQVMLNTGSIVVDNGDLTVDALGMIQTIWDGKIQSIGAGDIVLTSRTNRIHIGGSTEGHIDAAGTGNVVLTAGDGFDTSYGTLKGAHGLTLRAYDSVGTFRIGYNDFVKSGWVGLINGAEFSHVNFDGAGDVQVGNATFNKDVTIQAGGHIALGGALSVGTNDLVLQAGDGISQSGAASISSPTLTVLGTGDFDLSANGNNVGLLAANVDGALTYVNNGALIIGDSGVEVGVTATGAIDIATRSGNLHIWNAIATDDISDGAVVLNAGRDTAASHTAGGDINFTTGSVATGAGGRATLYTGSIANSLGVFDAAGGSGSGRFRYGSDETTTNYTAALDSGTHVVYRERPTLTVTPGAAKGQYGDAPDLSGVTVTATGYVNGDTSGLAGTPVFATAATATSNAGSYDLSYVSGLESALGYALDTSATGTYTVDPRVLNLSGTRTYDGTVNLDASIFGLGNLAHGDTLTLTGSGTMADKHAGDNKTVTLGALALADGADGSLASNYTLAGGTHTVDIGKRTVTVSGVTAANKVYDGNTTATVDASGVHFANLIEGDDLAVTSTGTFTDKNVAEGKTVNLINAYGGDDLANYSIIDQATTTADIERKAVTVGGSFTADDKIYDGGTAATIATNALTVAGTVAGETLGLTGVAAAFDDKNVAVGINVQLANAALTDGTGDASNYVLDLDGAPTTTADITPKSVTISGSFGVDGKIYDGGTAASISANALAVAGTVAGETLGLGDLEAAFDDKNVAADINVQLVYAVLADGTGSASNYVLDVTGAPTTTADITPKSVTVSGSFGVDDKIYDGGAAATIAANALTIAGTVAGETLALTGLAAAFDDKNVADDINVQLANATLADGTGSASNYVLDLTGAPTTTANITPKSLTVTGSFTASDKTYDGSTVAAIDSSGLTLSGLVAGEDLNLSGFSGAFADWNAGNAIVVNLDDGSLADGVNGAASNYRLDLTGAPTTTANILRRAVSVIANDHSKLQGTLDPAFTYSAEAQSAGRGLVAGESLFGALARAEGDVVGRYAIGPGSLTDANNGNYVIEFVDGTFTILPATEVEAAQHISQITHERVQSADAPQLPNHAAGEASADSASTGGGVRFVEIASSREGQAEVDSANEEQGASASRPDDASLTVLVVDGGIRLPTFQ